jgi:GNAT superfamily N-acetyltransferase
MKRPLALADAGVMTQDTRSAAVPVREHAGPRRPLRPLFELAEDSADELDSYIDAGRVLVARARGDVVGHLQLTETGRADELEIKNMAVLPDHQRHGVGRALMAAALDVARAEHRSTVVVATAAADIGNLRFYQRLGFRMRSIERDAFTEATGYAPGIVLDGIELRDRVWLDRPVDA